ncbi:unnamed protein product, partial [marine sediment metagenome]
MERLKRRFGVERRETGAGVQNVDLDLRAGIC